MIGLSDKSPTVAELDLIAPFCFFFSFLILYRIKQRHISRRARFFFPSPSLIRSRRRDLSLASHRVSLPSYTTLSGGNKKERFEGRKCDRRCRAEAQQREQKRARVGIFG